MKLHIPYLALVGMIAAMGVTGCGKGAAPTNPSAPPPSSPGELSVASSPSGAAIFLDGAATGHLTPDTLVQVAAGNHEVTLKLNHFADTSATVHVSTGSRAHVSLKMRYLQTYFPPPITFSRSTHEFYEDIEVQATGDFDRDGRLDLVMKGIDGLDRSHVRILVGQGNGTFVLGGSAVDTTAYVWGVTGGDFNRDSNPDLAILFGAGFESDLMIYNGRGDGTFERGAVLHSTINPQGQRVTRLRAADMTGDGVPDLLIGYGLRLGIWVANGDGTVRPLVSQSLSFGDAYPNEFVVADIDQDGISDVAQAVYRTGDKPSGLVLWSGLGNGSLRSNPTFLPTGGVPLDVGAGDFNRDGKQDLVAISSGGETGLGLAMVVLARGGGVFEAPYNHRTGISSRQVAVADFNADGYLDLVVLDFDSAGISSLAGLGDGVFEAAETSATTPSSITMVMGDFDGNGKPDLALTNTQGGFPQILDILLAR